MLGVSGPASKAHLNTKQGDYGVGQTPETYLGKERAENFNSPQTLKTGQFSFPDFLPVHAWALKGAWKIEPEKIVSGGAGSKLRLNFYARKVFLVMGTSSGKPVKAKLFLNGKPLLQGHGEDVHNGELWVKQHTLYELVGLSKRENAQLDIQAESPGLEAYAFTFSS